MRSAWIQVGVVVGGLFVLTACTPELPVVDDPCVTWPEPGLYKMTMDGFDRMPYIYVPATKGPRPAVVMMHGAGGNADKMMHGTTRLLNMAEDGQFVAVFPTGSGTPTTLSWNAGTCCGPAKLVDATDVAFLDAISDNLKQRVCVDRVVGAGHSNGAMMAIRWACEGHGVDAVYSSSGATLVDTCADGTPVPITFEHGLDDARVPIDGGLGTADQNGFEWPSHDDSIAPFLERNQCVGEPSVTKSGQATCSTWDCAVPTRACVISDWGHEWAGGANPPDGFNGEAEVTALLDMLSESIDVDPTTDTDTPGAP
jgi:polyhydroxybutyrate depolymerase